MLEIQRVLQDNPPSYLKEVYGINHSIDPQYPNLYLFKYDQINSPMGEVIVQQARGIILDSSNGWNIISRPYDKFFNYGEGHAPAIDWDSARVQEKLDGTCIQMYYYDGKWEISTLGKAGATGNVGAFNNLLTFNDLFWQVFQELGYSTPKDKECTYIFELMTPLNKVIVQHTSNRIVLHGVRHTLSGEYMPLQDFSNGWEVVKEYSITPSIEEIKRAAGILSPMHIEGFVIVDKHYSRVKVKSPAYVALHHQISNLNNCIDLPSLERALLELVKVGEEVEFLTYFPEHRQAVYSLQYRYHTLIEEITKVWEENKGITDRKEFALKVKDLPYSYILFSLLSNKVSSVKEAVQTLPVDKLHTLLEGY